MSQAKTERLVNLTMALLATPRYLTVEDIGRLVSGYQPADGDIGDGAFRRMFERDKEELRELGIPLETGQVDPLYGAELGYRIRRSDYALPPITLDPDEAAALGLAARLWSSAGLANASAGGMRKLAAAGIDVISPPQGLDARVDATEPSFGPLYDAVRARCPVTFGYRRTGGQLHQRRLQPWGVVSNRGHWYVAGYDLDRAAPRVFRLSRLSGDVAAAGAAGSFAVPAGTDLRALVSSVERQPTTGTARLWLRPGAGHRLRRIGIPVDGAADMFTVPYSDADRFADEIVGYGPDVSVVAPADLRAQVVARLRTAVASLGGSPGAVT